FSTHVPHGNRRTEGYEPPSFSMLVRTRVSDNTIEPGRELRVLMKLIDAGEQFQEYLLSDIARYGLVAAVMKGDRVDAIFVCFKEVVKCVPITLLAGPDHFSLRLVITNYRELLHLR